MRVRPLLLLTIAAAGMSSPAFGQTMSSAASPGTREQTADQQVRHVLNRLAFGARPGDYEKVREVGVDAWIDQQLHPEKIADPAATQFIAQLRSYLATPAELQREYPRPQIAQQQMARARTAADSMALRQEQRQDQQGARQMVAEVQAARLGRAVVSERQLEEVMVDFWLNHFSVYLQKNQQMRYYLASYDRDVIRPRIFGKFRDLLGAVAHSPAMLIYLDNAQSVADTGRRTYVMQPGQGGRGRGSNLADRLAARGGRGPVGPVGTGQPPQQQRRASGLNENYGRELLELHTLGVDGGYTQKDVTEVSRALTGWSVVPPALNQMDAAGAGRGGRAAARPGRGRGGQVAAQYGVVTEGMFMFRGPAHDAEEKVVLGHKLKAGRGLEDGEEVLDILSRHPSTANYIATKLARRFVSDDPPSALVKRAADVFRKTDGNIREVVRTIITSPEFFASAAYRSKVKTPFEVVASAMRAVGAPADATPRTAQLLATLGQPIFGRQTPDGWPEVGTAWVNTGSILNRINFGTAVAAGRVPGSNPSSWPLPLSLRRAPREEQVDAVIAAFLGGEASIETRTILISGTNPLLAAVKPDSSGMGGRVPPDSVANVVAGMSGADLARALGGRAFQQLPVLEGVPQIVGLALGSPEFQRR